MRRPYQLDGVFDLLVHFGGYFCRVEEGLVRERILDVFRAGVPHVVEVFGLLQQEGGGEETEVFQGDVFDAHVEVLLGEVDVGLELLDHLDVFELCFVQLVALVDQLAHQVVVEVVLRLGQLLVAVSEELDGSHLGQAAGTERMATWTMVLLLTFLMMEFLIESSRSASAMFFFLYAQRKLPQGLDVLGLRLDDEVDLAELAHHLEEEVELVRQLDQPRLLDGRPGCFELCQASPTSTILTPSCSMSVTSTVKSCSNRSLKYSWRTDL